MSGEPVPFSDEEDGLLIEASAPETAADGVDITPAPDEAESREKGSFLSWLRGLLVGADLRRLDELDEAIRLNPDIAVNYILRAELYMNWGEYTLAAVDFETGLKLAASQFETESWGFLSQTLRDQAEHGLERARRKLVRGQAPQIEQDGETG